MHVAHHADDGTNPPAFAIDLVSDRVFRTFPEVKCHGAIDQNSWGSFRSVLFAKEPASNQGNTGCLKIATADHAKSGQWLLTLRKRRPAYDLRRVRHEWQVLGGGPKPGIITGLLN